MGMMNETPVLEEIDEQTRTLTAECIRIGTMSSDGELARMRKLRAAEELIASFAWYLVGIASFLALDAEEAPTSWARLTVTDPAHEAALTRAAAPCVCGLDRGDHLIEAPHASDDGDCPGFVERLAHRDTLPAADAAITVHP